MPTNLLQYFLLFTTSSLKPTFCYAVASASYLNLKPFPSGDEGNISMLPTLDYLIQDLVLAGTEEYFSHYMAIFTPVYITLVQILLRKIQYPEEAVYRSMSAEEKEQFRCYRQDIIDTVV